MGQVILDTCWKRFFLILFQILLGETFHWSLQKRNLHFLVSSLISCFLLKKCFVVCGFVKNTFWQKTFILLFIIITIANFWHKPLSEKLNIKAAAASATSMTKLANVVASTTERQLLRQSVFDTFGLMYKKALFVYSSTIQTNKPQNIIFLRNFYRFCKKGNFSASYISQYFLAKRFYDIIYS